MNISRFSSDPCLANMTAPYMGEHSLWTGAVEGYWVDTKHFSDLAFGALLESCLQWADSIFSPENCLLPFNHIQSKNCARPCHGNLKKLSSGNCIKLPLCCRWNVVTVSSHASRKTWYGSEFPLECTSVYSARVLKARKLPRLPSWLDESRRYFWTACVTVTSDFALPHRKDNSFIYSELHLR